MGLFFIRGRKISACEPREGGRGHPSMRPRPSRLLIGVIQDAEADAVQGAEGELQFHPVVIETVRFERQIVGDLRLGGSKSERIEPDMWTYFHQLQVFMSSADSARSPVRMRQAVAGLGYIARGTLSLQILLALSPLAQGGDLQR